MDGSITYCYGKGCILRSHCKRYLDGQRIIVNIDGDTGQYIFTDNCNIENRELFMPTNEVK